MGLGYSLFSANQCSISGQAFPQREEPCPISLWSNRNLGA